LEAGADVGDEDEDEPESAALLRSDPSKWKTQDHYAVLGLSRKRYGANNEDIKLACKFFLPGVNFCF
jgi:DnaJ family protein C protein 2